MNLEAIDCHRYSVPFSVPFTTSQGIEQYRQGLILRLKTGDGVSGYGEAVALPSFGTAPLDVLERHFHELSSEIIGMPVDEAHALIEQHTVDQSRAPLWFALDTALLDIESQTADLPLSRFLSPDAASTVPLNATISDMDARGAANAAYYAVTGGYSAVKMKVGAYAEPVGEVARVAAVREAIGPEIELRLDVNGAWPIERAVEMASAFEQYDIGYLEQPLPASDIEAMAKLRQEINVPLAADEAATSRRAVEELIEFESVDVIVIKPAVVGGITVARELIELAASAGIQVVVTSSLETGVGITAALHLAATLTEPVPACGLATGALLETDLLVESPAIESGRMEIPRSPGLGVEPLASIWGEEGLPGILQEP